VRAGEQVQRLLSEANRTPTILVVSDEYLVLAMLSDHLQGCGFKVLKALNADEAVSIIENTGMPIDRREKRDEGQLVGHYKINQHASDYR